MKADPSRQWRLLDLQALDTRRDQIAHRLNHLPQDELLAEQAAKRSRLETDIVTTRTAWQDLQREIGKAEADVDQVRERAARDRRLLEAATTSAKDLQALQHELVSLGRRQEELEEVQLEIMERSESLQATLAQQEADHRELLEAIAATTEQREATVREFEAEVADIAVRREPISAGVGADLLTLYEKIRAGSGTGAALLRQRRCEGCRLELVGADMQRIASADPAEVIRCEECRTILVRTAESGL